MTRIHSRHARIRGTLLCAVAVACTPAIAHQGIHNAGARDACKVQALGDACEWHDEQDALYIGTCRNVASSLLCVRNKPIVYPESQSDDSSPADSHDN